MIYGLDYDQFRRLAKTGNLVCVWKELLADTETPVSAFMKLNSYYPSGSGFLLESVEGGEKIGRYSFLAVQPARTFKFPDKPQSDYTENDPLREIQKFLATIHPALQPELPRFSGGLVGYLGYESIRYFERVPVTNPDAWQFPVAQFMLPDTLLAFDHVRHSIVIIVPVHTVRQSDNSRLWNSALKKIGSIERALSMPLQVLQKRHSGLTVKPRSNFTEKEFCQAVSRAKKYIRSGDIIQTVISQRWGFQLGCDPFQVYRALRVVNPSPYMFFLKFNGLCLIGSSPELLVRVEGSRVTQRPIAGTRPRGKNELEDKRLEKSLIRSTKERAEHIMLVDLARNDIGRVCRAGSIRIPEMFVIEKYSHVQHLVSEVTGSLHSCQSSFDVLRSSFPAGTVTGAPKIRAMEIINELERTQRGPYAGAVGYFDFHGNMDTCIGIRMIVVKGNRAFVQAGAGIVADSRPERELEETRNKARALIRAVELASSGVL